MQIGNIQLIFQFKILCIFFVKFCAFHTLFDTLLRCACVYVYMYYALLERISMMYSSSQQCKAIKKLPLSNQLLVMQIIRFASILVTQLPIQKHIKLCFTFQFSHLVHYVHKKVSTLWDSHVSRLILEKNKLFD